MLGLVTVEKLLSQNCKAPNLSVAKGYINLFEIRVGTMSFILLLSAESAALSSSSYRLDKNVISDRHSPV